jgi:hypothetical protein
VYIRKIVRECLHPLLGRGADHLPSSSAEVKERVDLDIYLYFSSESSWPVIRRHLICFYLTDNGYGLRKPRKCPQKEASGPDPDLKEIIPNSLNIFLYYAF